MYEYADKIINYLNGQFIEKFGKLKSTLYFDELNVLQSVQSLYRELEELVRQMLYLIAVHAYESASGGDSSAITELWLLEAILQQYDPVTKYVFINEVERKCSRLFEAMIASDDPSSEVDRALRLWSSMIAQYAITTTDAATLQAYRDVGITAIIWVSVKDNKRCEICENRDGTVYPIDDIPPKPHIRCRCRLMPYTEG